MAAVELSLWLLSFIVVAGLLGIVVYQVSEFLIMPAGANCLISDIVF